MRDVIEMSGTADEGGNVAVIDAEPPTDPSFASTLTPEKREELIMVMRDAKVSFTRIGEILGISGQRVHQIYSRALLLHRDKYTLDVATRRRAAAISLMMGLETIEYKIHDETHPSTNDEWTFWLQTLKALTTLLGLEEPKRMAATHDVTMVQDNPIAAEHVARLAAFIEKTRAISVEGAVRPPLPPGMTERAMVGPASNGHVHVGPHGQGMWSMVLEYPRPD